MNRKSVLRARRKFLLKVAENVQEKRLDNPKQRLRKHQGYLLEFSIDGWHTWCYANDRFDAFQSAVEGTKLQLNETREKNAIPVRVLAQEFCETCACKDIRIEDITCASFVQIHPEEAKEVT